MNINEIFEYQSSYLETLEEFFNRIVGRDVLSFQSFDEVLEVSKKNLVNSGQITNPYIEFFENLQNLYSQKGIQVYKYIQEMNTCKLVLGGSSRFYGSHLNATRSSLLFTDTVLIPDPILPYLEKERSEEKFQYVPILKAVFFILQLKSLHSSSFETLPFIIFPSWEKSLESHDSYTYQQTQQLITDVFSHYVDSGIHTLEDAYEFSKKNKEVFFKQIEQNRLLVAPGRKPGDDIQTSLKYYKEEVSIVNQL